jgi:hypothetical protein
MLGVEELNTTIDSLYKSRQKSIDLFSKTMNLRSYQNNLNLNYNAVKSDSIVESPENIFDLFTNKKQIQLYEIAITSVNSVQDDIKVKNKSFFIANMNIINTLLHFMINLL